MSSCFTVRVPPKIHPPYKGSYLAAAQIHPHGPHLTSQKQLDILELAAA